MHVLGEAFLQGSLDEGLLLRNLACEAKTAKRMLIKMIVFPLEPPV